MLEGDARLLGLVLALVDLAQDHLHHLYEEVRTFAAPIRVKREPCNLGQIVQETLNRIRVRYVPAGGLGSASRHLIVQRLHERLGPVHVVLEEVSDIPRGANGKFRTVLCALPDGGERAVVAGERGVR